MNWEALGAIAEGLGAAGVIASLLYLSVQVRAGTRAAAVDAKLASTRMYTDFLVLLVESPELNDLMIRGRSNLESLDKEEYLRYSNLALISFCFFLRHFFSTKRARLATTTGLSLV